MQQMLGQARWTDSAAMHGLLCELAVYFLLYRWGKGPPAMRAPPREKKVDIPQ